MTADSQTNPAITVHTRHRRLLLSVTEKMYVCRAELQSLAEMIEASLSAAELKVKQKRQEELARMRCMHSDFLTLLSLYSKCNVHCVSKNDTDVAHCNFNPH